MRLKIVIFVVLSLFAVLPLFARDVEITVVDTELELPLEGAVIRSWDGLQHVCDEDGKALVTVPDERQVVIQAVYPGYENGRLIIAPGTDAYTLRLRLSGIMEGKELVVEAARPGTSETQTGRSVAVSGRDIAQTAEIGVIEDVMSSIKLLPGVGYTGLFDAQPSIRGGDPGDMRASLDGFYVFNPYHWGGGFSIFDPRMVESAQLSHGVFSSRYGHTISGLLDVTTKDPSPTETQFELGLNTSAANMNLSVPLAGKSSTSRGGILFMGRVTYYDPVIWMAKQLAKGVDKLPQDTKDDLQLEQLQAVNAIQTAPYIRSATITGNYRFTDNLELKATGFWGMDGVAVKYENSARSDGNADALNDMIMNFAWTNYQGFISNALSWNPRNDMLLKFTAGTGYEKTALDGDIQYNIINKPFVKTSANEWYYDTLDRLNLIDNYNFDTTMIAKQTDLVVNAQGRIDYDWELGKGFLLASGVQEMFTHYDSRGNQFMTMEKMFHDFDSETQKILFEEMGINDPNIQNSLRPYLIVSLPLKYDPNAGNNMFTSSAYGLMEYHTPGNRFKTELGMRVDHYYLMGEGFSLQTKPAVNPRLNLDFNVFKNLGFVQSFDLSAGTGLFSSMNNSVYIAEEQYNVTEIKPNRSWTSVLGTKLELFDSFIFNIEGYYKYTFDRMYLPISAEIDTLDVRPQFNGEGKVWGFDLLLQKTQSRYWDGWVSYSFNWAKYRDPDAGNADIGFSGGLRGNDWYFPSYHRFHNLNLVLNIKPVSRINIYTRLGLASGVQISRRTGDGPLSYPVYVYDPDNPDNNKFIELFYWPSVQDENNRTTPSLPLDIKVSIFGNSRSGKVLYEIYMAIENVLGLLYSAKGNTSFNQYTGEVVTGSMSAVYEIPIPIPSFGFKISY